MLSLLRGRCSAVVRPRCCRSLSTIPENVKAVYLSRKIDVLSMHKQTKGRLLEDEYLVVPLTPAVEVKQQPSQVTVEDKQVRRRIPVKRTEDLNEKEQEQGRHCVFFSHGAVVFFNCDEQTQKDVLSTCKPFTKGVLDQTVHEDFELRIDPSLEDWSRFAPNKLLLQRLDLKNISVIAVVMAQAVSLQHFENEIDNLLESFENKKPDAVGILKQSSKVLRDVIWTLGLLDHASESSPAWQDERYHRIWSGLREEFEIEKRWRVLQTKASFLQEDIKFAVELAHARTSERLEIAIIALITAELSISVYHLFH